MRIRTFGGLWLEPDADASESQPRPRSLALLAIVAAAGSKGVSRDQVVGLLWPESPSDRARHVLSQTLYGLRRELGKDVLVAAGADLRIDPDLLTSDVGDFRQAIKNKEWATAGSLYEGAFLAGFYLTEATEFERWAEAERAALQSDAMRAIERTATTDRSAGRIGQAAERWHRLTQLDPLNARFAVAYMEALAALGDRTAALAHARTHTERVVSELESDPDQSVVELTARLRQEPTPPTSREVYRAPEFKPSQFAEQLVAPELPARPRVRRTVIAVAGIFGLALLGALGWRLAAPNTSPPVLAIGRIRDVGLNDSAAFAGVSSEMLSTSLGRVTELRVVSNARMLELAPRGNDSSRAAVVDAARRAGATEMIEGELIALGGHRLRLELRQIDLSQGLVRAAYQVVGNDRIALLDSVTTLIAAHHGVGAPAGSLAEVSTRSPVAYRAYEEGLRRWQEKDWLGARDLFRSAVREDSSFAMATYYLWRGAHAAGDTDRWTLSTRALRLASRASERDRLLIQTHVAMEQNDLRGLAFADSLASRYSSDPEALIRAAETFVRAGSPAQLIRATELANRSIAIDSAASAIAAPLCRACEAFSILVSRYWWADSLDLAERTARRWAALRPDDAAPWGILADVLVARGRRAEAEKPFREALARGQVVADSTISNLTTSLRTDDFVGIDSACAAGFRRSNVSDFMAFRWYCSLGMRMEGRYADAMRLLRDGRVPQTGARRQGVPGDSLVAATLEMETGNGRAAMNIFMARERDVERGTLSETGKARGRTWELTLAATAAILGGDTLTAHGLVDSVETIGRRSMYGRDPLLHHFIRGALLARANQDVPAVRELRASIFSPTNGYTRCNYELGQALLRLKRPAEGISIVRAALHGGVEGSGLYLTRTELHDLLAGLFDAAGQRDSAAAHYAIVERAWRNADPFLQPRYQKAKQWLERTGG